MMNTKKCINRSFCIFLQIICDDAHHLVAVRDIGIAKGIVPVVKGLSKSNMYR